jgi:hypothetical protein
MIADFIKQLRQLPYADMMKVAGELSLVLNRGQKNTRAVQEIAAALSELSTMHIDDSVSTQQENKILREMFRTKRTISIKEFNGGFNIELSTLRGHMMHKDLKQGLGQMLDTLVAARALEK